MTTGRDDTLDILDAGIARLASDYYWNGRQKLPFRPQLLPFEHAVDKLARKFSDEARRG